MDNHKLKIVIVDDEIRALNRMKILLQNFDDVEILEQFYDANKAIDYIVEIEPDIAFLDIEMPGKTGLEIANEINKSNLHTKIVFVSSHDHYAIKAIKNNAFDYLLKPVCIDDLKASFERYKAEFQSNLTKRENEIIRLIAKGYNSKKIGNKLCISHHTVDTHRKKILEKTECKNAVELTLFATNKNLL